MDELFFNKIFAIVLSIVLALMALSTLGEILYHPDIPDKPSYPIDMAALTTPASSAEEEEKPIDFGLLLASADIGAGERVVRVCTSCHAFNQGGANGTGPALWDVLGRAVASADGFSYSGAFNDYAADGRVWSYENMNAFLQSPRRYISGTAMSYVGLRKEEDRINLIAYMRTLSDAPIALPEPFPVEDTPVDDSVLADNVAEL